MEGKITIKRYDGGTSVWNKRKRYHNCDNFDVYISAAAKKILNCSTVCIRIKNGVITIRAATIDDTRTHKITAYSIRVGSAFEDHTGDYYIEKDEEGQDEYELYKL